MAKVIQEADYIKKRKKKYLTSTIISLSIMMAIFILGLILTKTRNNLFTLFAVLLTLAVAQYGVQYISIMKYKDGDLQVSKELARLPNNYIVWNSAIFGDKIGVAFFDHVIITDQKIFCIVDHVTKTYEQNVLHMKRIIQNKGLQDNIVFIKKENDEFTKFINTLQYQEIKDLENQEELVKALKSAAI